MTKIVSSMKPKRIGYIAIAAMIVAFSVLFPIHVETPEPDTYVFRIGNIVTAHDPDATCDGIDDNVQFQQILDALPSDVGGRIEVEAGYYSWDTGETVTRNISNVTIIGVGGLVSFDGDDTTALFTAGGNNWHFENIVTDAGGIDLGSTSDYLLLNVLVDSTFYAFVTDDIDILDHGARHESGGDDEIKLDDLGTPDDNTDLNASTERHGLLPKLAGNTSLYLRSDGTWQYVAGGGGDGDMLKATYDNDEDGLIDAAAGGTEWDSSAVTGVAYITAGTWSSKTIGIADTNILVVSGTVNNGEHCRFTATGIEGLTNSELLADLSGDAGGSFDWNGQDLTNVGNVDGRDVSADGTKLDGIEAGADVTDATNVNAAGAVMESDFDATTFLYATLDNTPEAKTPAQVLAILSGNAGGSFDWNGQDLTNVGNVDGRDVSADGTKLDGIEAGADVTDATNVNAAGAVMESDFDADTFMYATLDDTPAATSPADVLATLSGHAGATFDWNSQYLTNIGNVGIADDNLVEIDDADAADNDYAKFTANGLEGRDYNEVRTDLEVPDTTTAEITLYVDSDSGDDSNDGSSGSPKETIQGALDALPSIIAHTVTINVREGTAYSESDTLLNFDRFTTCDYITIQAVNGDDDVMYDRGTSSDGSVTTLVDDTKSWEDDQFNGAYIWITDGTGEGQIAIITDTSGGDTITIDGVWTDPSSDSIYVIGGGVDIDIASSHHFRATGSKKVNIYGFHSTEATSWTAYYELYSCGSYLYNYCDNTGHGCGIYSYSSVTASYNYIDTNTSNGVGVGITTAYGTPRGAYFVDCDIGVKIYYDGFASFYNSPQYLSYFDTCDYGVWARYGSAGSGSSINNFDGCTIDHQATDNSWET